MVVPIDVGSGLSMVDRFQHWSRWSSPSTRSIRSTQRAAQEYKQITNAFRQLFKVAGRSYQEALETELHWQSDITYWDSVTLGQIVFPTSNIPSKQELFQPSLQKTPREFVTLVPGLLSSLEIMGRNRNSKPRSMEEFLLIRLTPSHKNNLPVPIEALPDLEIKILFDQDSKTSSIRGVRLVIKEELDVLQPRNTVDLRFTRRTCVYALEDGLDSTIQQFVNDSNLDIRGTGRFKTPSGLSMVIPPHSIGLSRDGQAKDTLEQMRRARVEYDFASLDHRSEIGVDMRGPGPLTYFTYTSIEAGITGGRRDELVIKHLTEPYHTPPVNRKRLKGVSPGEDYYDDDYDSVGMHYYNNFSGHLLRRTNWLVFRMEQQPKPGRNRKIYSVGSVQRGVNKARTLEERTQQRRKKRSRVTRVHTRRKVVEQKTQKRRARLRRLEVPSSLSR